MRFYFILALSSFFVFVAQADRHHKQPGNAPPDRIKYSYNWAGAVWDEDDGTFTFVTGTFTVPIPSGSSGSVASAWVGIDGNSCHNGGLLQGGVDFVINDQGEILYNAWHGWYPDLPHYFDLPVSAGDVIRVNVTSSSRTSGHVTIENFTKGLSLSERLTSIHKLCGKNAEWIVEDYPDDKGNLFPFANFGTVVFTDTMASGPSRTYTSDGAAIIDIQQNHEVLTSVTIKGSSVTVSR